MTVILKKYQYLKKERSCWSPRVWSSRKGSSHKFKRERLENILGGEIARLKFLEKK